MYGLPAKETIELRIKCLEPFISVASKLNIEQGIVFQKAEEAWKFATRTLEEEHEQTTNKSWPADGNLKPKK